MKIWAIGRGGCLFFVDVGKKKIDKLRHGGEDLGYFRGTERIIARGDTLLKAGDKAIVVTKAFEDTQTYLVEKTVKQGGKRAGHAIRDYSGDGLVLLVKRGDKEIIPSGDTVLQAGDTLVILKSRQ